MTELFADADARVAAAGETIAFRVREVASGAIDVLSMITSSIRWQVMPPAFADVDAVNKLDNVATALARLVQRFRAELDGNDVRVAGDDRG